jgi:hypothetical protein
MGGLEEAVEREGGMKDGEMDEGESPTQKGRWRRIEGRDRGRYSVLLTWPPDVLHARCWDTEGESRKRDWE